MGLAADRHVQIAGGGGAAVDDRAGKRHPVAAGDEPTAGGLDDLAGRERPPRGHGGRRLFAVVEVDLVGARVGGDDLVILVALAGDDDDVARHRLGHRRADGDPPVGIDEERVGHRRQDHVDDRLWVLGARVVRGDHRQVGQLGHGSAHDRPLGRIAVTAAAEHADQPAAGERAQRAEDVAQRIGRVGVVDQDVEAGAVDHPLDPTRDPGHGVDAAGDGVVVQAQRLGHADGDGDVADVVAAEQRARGDLDRPGRRVDGGGDAVDAGVGAGHADLGVDVGADADPQHPVLAGRGDHVRRRRIVGVDHRDAIVGQVVGEQPRLGRAVGVHVAVDVEVVLGQVGERAHAKAQPGHPVHRQRRARHLHDRVAAAGIGHGSKGPVEDARRRRGVRRVDGAPAEAVADGAQHAGRRARRLEDRLEQEGDGGLAVGSGDADQLQPVGRVAGHPRHQHAERLGAVGDDHLRHVGVDLVLGDHGDGAALDRAGDEAVAVGAARDGDEQRALAGLARVVDHGGHLRVAVADDPGRGKQRCELGQPHD